MQFNENYGPMEIDDYDPNDEPVCVCEDYVGAEHPVFCKACMMYTDNKELLMAFEQAVETTMAVAAKRLMGAAYEAMAKKEEAA